MLTTAKNFNRKLLGQVILLAVLLLVLIVPGRSNGSISAGSLRIKQDTLPPADVSKLKRSDIYVVIVKDDSAQIQLKNRDYIVMGRTDFEALPASVRKQISPQNDGVFPDSHVESTYPGGVQGWSNYLIRAFRYPVEAQANKIQGVVVVQFVVDERGKLSKIEAVSGPESGGLREEAIRVVKESGKWEPAIWNGYKIATIKRQSVIFRVE